MLRITLLALLLALSLSAGMIASDFLQLNWYSDGGSGGWDSGTSLTNVGVIGDGWNGSADLTTNISGGSFDSPSALRLTNLSVTCTNTNGCSGIEFDFAGGFNFAGPAPEFAAGAPYGVTLTGSGPNGYFSYQIATGQFAGGTSGGALAAGQNYTFSTSSSLMPGNYSASSVLPGNYNVAFSGSFWTDSAGYNETVSLPGSFDFNVGSNDNVPEPGSWLLASIPFGLGLAAMAWRRRRQAARVL